MTVTEDDFPLFERKFSPHQEKGVVGSTQKKKLTWIHLVVPPKIRQRAGAQGWKSNSFKDGIPVKQTGLAVSQLTSAAAVEY